MLTLYDINDDDISKLDVIIHIANNPTPEVEDDIHCFRFKLDALNQWYFTYQKVTSRILDSTLQSAISFLVNTLIPSIRFRFSTSEEGQPFLLMRHAIRPKPGSMDMKLIYKFSLFPTLFDSSELFSATLRDLKSMYGKSKLISSSRSIFIYAYFASDISVKR